MKFEKLISLLPANFVKELKLCEQDPYWHPEGSVYTHTKIVFNRAKNKFPDDLDLQIAAIFHDTGKLYTTKKYKKGETIRISHHRHETFSLKVFIKFNIFFTKHITDTQKIRTIIKEHMRIKLYLSGEMKDLKKRKEIEENLYFQFLKEFAEFDKMVNGNGNKTFSENEI